MENIRISEIRLKLQDCGNSQDDISINFSLGNQLSNIYRFSRIQYNRVRFQEEIQFLICDKYLNEKLSFTVFKNETTKPEVLAKNEIQVGFLKHYMKKKNQMKQPLVKNYLIVGWIYFQCTHQAYKQEIPVQLFFIKNLSINYFKKPWINYKLKIFIDRKQIFRQRVRGNIFQKQISIGVASIVKNSTALQIFFIDQDQIKPEGTQSSHKISNSNENSIPKFWNLIEDFQKQKLNTLTFPLKQQERQLGTCQLKYIVTETFLPLEKLSIYKTGFLNIHKVLKIDKREQYKSSKKLKTTKTKYNAQTIINHVKKIIIQQKQDNQTQNEQKQSLIYKFNYLKFEQKRTSFEIQRKSKTLLDVITLKTEKTPGRQQKSKSNTNSTMYFQEIQSMLQ